MYRLTTRDGDEWDFEDLEEARKNQYIFGGIIKEICIKQTNESNYTNGGGRN